MLIPKDNRKMLRMTPYIENSISFIVRLDFRTGRLQSISVLEHTMDGSLQIKTPFYYDGKV